jgi:hypothetical protein
MDASTLDSGRRRAGPPRRLVLAGAVALALAIALAPRTPVAEAQEAAPAAKAEAVAPAAAASPGGGAAPKAPAEGEHHGVAIRIGIDTDSGSDGKPKADADAASASATTRVENDATSGHRTITIKKNGKTVTLTGPSDDHMSDSFGDFMDKQPATAFMIVAIVAVVFLSPVLLIAVVLAYRMRKVRLQNETMLKLAERGVVAPGDAIAAVAAGALPADVALDGRTARGAAATSPAERVAAIRQRAAWSDLRKGVVIGAVGLGLTLFSIIDDGTPNSVGLVLLFLGVGYALLWWFEERQVGQRNGAGRSSTGTGPGGTP